MRIRTKRELGLTLKELRQRQKLTQAALAEQLGVSRHWVNRVEQARTNADLYTVLRALKFLGAELAVFPREPVRDSEVLASVLARTSR